MTETKNVRPSKEVLEKLIKEKGYKYTGAQYGVSDNTARRWAMAYGIDLTPKCELKARARQGYKLVDGKYVYEKYLKNTSEDQSERPAKKSPQKKDKTAVAVLDEKKVPTGTKPKEIVPAFVKQPVRQHPVVDLSKIKNRYSQEELNKFRVMVEDKIREGFEAIIALKESLSRVGENGTDDTASSGNVFEEGTLSMERENMTELVAKKQKHLNALNAALVRIGNGTYGICMVTGQLIPKERLQVVPHATKCVEAKADQDNGKVIAPVEATEDVEEDK